MILFKKADPTNYILIPYKRFYNTTVINPDHGCHVGCHT